MAAPASAQNRPYPNDFSGHWIPIFHEDEPDRGTGPALNDLVAGHVDLTFTAGGMTYADQVKVLGVTSAICTSAAPQVPAIAETVPGYEATIWFGFLAPAGTPKETVDRRRAR